MKEIELQLLTGINEDFKDIIYKAMKDCDNEKRLLVCLYFMSDLNDNSTTLQSIENNLIKIFHPAINSKYTPKDYASFQASVIRGMFDRETEKVNKGILLEEDRLWHRVGKDKWRNSYIANEKAIKILYDKNIQIIKVNYKKSR